MPVLALGPRMPCTKCGHFVAIVCAGRGQLHGVPYKAVAMIQHDSTYQYPVSIVPLQRRESSVYLCGGGLSC